MKFSGSEKITDENGNSVSTVKDFWSWAYSNLTSNTQRGTYAEYLVSIALGAKAETKTDWGPYDILTPEGIKVEVKASGYMQTWKQAHFSKIVFGINQSHKYDYNANEYNYDAEMVRQADVYVFCVEKCQDVDSLNERDLSQWDFYVISARRIDESLGSHKTVTLSKLIKIGAQRVSFNNMKAAVLAAYAGGKKENFIRFYKDHPTDKVWWVVDKEPATPGKIMFTFDKKKIYYLYTDYPNKLTPEEKEIFDKENPFWVDFFSEKD